MISHLTSTLNDSLFKLMGEEQKAVKTKPFDLQLDPAKSDMSLHKLDKAKDKNFCSIRERRNEEKFNAVALRHLPR